MKKILIIYTLLLLFSACNKQTETVNKTEDSVNESLVKLTDIQIKNAGIKTALIEEKSIAYTLKVNGKIDVPPQNMVSVSAQLGGYLKSSQLLPGMKVKKGEIIAIMEDQQYIQIQQDYLITKTKLNYLEKEYSRQKELNDSKASSDKVFQQTEAEYQSQKIALKALYEKLKLIGVSPESLSESNISRNVNIYAPIDGFVSSVNVNIGKYVNPSDVLFELVNPTDIHLSLTVFEKDIEKLFVGQKVIAYNNNEPDKKHDCAIILIGQHLSNERSTEIHCHFNDYDKTLLPGMYMNAEIEIKSNKAKALPSEAIVSFDDKNYIFIKEGTNNFLIQEVTIGNTENNYTEIINSEKYHNKQIVITGAYSLLMSLKNAKEE